VPPLVDRVAALTSGVLERLEAENAPDLASYVSGKTKDILVLIGRIAHEQSEADYPAMDEDVRQRVLGDMFQLMVALSALGDVLKLAGRALSSDGIRPPPKRRLGDRIDHFLDRTIQIPANEIKHRGFDMGWLTLRSAFGVTHGYTVSGRVGSKLNAPIKYRDKDKSSPDGYSFAYVLRNSVTALFGICDALDAAFQASGCYVSPPPSPRSRAETSPAVTAAIAHINGLPQRGFFDERGLEVPILKQEDGTLTATMRRLRTHPPGTKVHFALNSVAAGVTYKLPYWPKNP